MNLEFIKNYDSGSLSDGEFGVKMIKGVVAMWELIELVTRIGVGVVV